MENINNDIELQKNYDQNKPTYIVGIGASAGGLEALQNLLQHLPKLTGMAFIIVQHLSPNHKSFMAELLSRNTSMETIEIQNKTIVEADKVYILPPKNSLTIQNGTLYLVETEVPKRLNKPIDLFLQSLATDQREQAIGIILSGTGSDGSVGVEAIKKHGGLVIVQQESSAKFDGMPKNAILTGNVDYILSPERIGTELESITNRDKNDYVSLTNMESYQELEKDIDILLSIIKGKHNIDFTYYKPSSIFRRLEKRMGINRIYQIKEYIQYLNDNPDEISKLKKDLLIGVTCFFRDAYAFEHLSQVVIPTLFENKKEEKEIRVWTVACSTGEEVYSLAILFRQYMKRTQQEYTVKIFATDIDEDSVDFASRGMYPESITHEVPSELLEEYFIKTKDGYSIQDSIRKMIVFAQHDVLKDPPFINMDFITCRNMLIYLKSQSQKKVLSLFHFSLHAEGFLFLGSSETVGKSTNLFETFNRKWSMFRSRVNTKFSVSNSIQFNEHVKNQLHMTNRRQAVSERITSSTNQSEIETKILNQYIPATVILNENNEMIHCNGPVNAFLRVPQGEPTNEILRMVLDELSVAVRAAIHKVRREKIDVVYHDIKLNSKAPSQYINLMARPFVFDGNDNLIILSFIEVEQRSTHYRITDQVDSDNDLIKRIDELELELQHAKEYLQITKEELEAANEELQSTNEELIAANEELQSSNEELQSLNEELITVNNEYQEKIEELIQLTEDIDNLLISTEIGTIFLDHHLLIRRFTPMITEQVNLIEVDIGRPLHHISHKFKYGSLAEDAEKVLHNSQKIIEKEIESFDGKWYSLKVLPYVSKTGKTEGVVLTFNDITELKNLNENLQLLSYAIQQSPSSIVIFNMNGKVEYVNPSLIQRSGYMAEELLGQNLTDLYPDMGNESSHIWDTVKSGQKWVGELKNIRKNNELYWESVNLLPIKNNSGETIHYLIVGEDITERKKAEDLLLEADMLSAIGQLAAGIAHEIRNPLTALKGFTQLIKSEIQNREYIQIMESEIDRINIIVSELLFLSKPRAVEYEEKNVISIIREVCDLLESQAIMNNIELIQDFEVEKYTIDCVEHQLKQVFINIIKNAIEAMPNGGRITILASLTDPSAISISIQDEGKGIPRKLQSKIGQPFFSTKEKGTGLGLMVSHKIIQNHDGELNITSKENIGTKIQIVLSR